MRKPNPDLKDYMCSTALLYTAVVSTAGWTHIGRLRGFINSPLGWTGCRPGWSWRIPSGSFSLDLSGRWPTPSHLPEPYRLRGANTHTSEFIVLIVEQTGERGGHGHTSTFHVLSLSRCLGEAQEETQSHTRREQRNRFSHLAPSVTVTHTGSSASQAETFKHWMASSRPN